MIGAMAVISAETPNSFFHCGCIQDLNRKSIGQVPSPAAQAASIRFSAASQQSATTNGPSGFPQITTNVPAV